MKLRIAFGVVVLLAIPALIVLFVATQLFSTDRETASAVPIPVPRIDEAIPRPPANQPIRGDKVTLEEAQERTPYTIPIPPRSVVDADLDEVWASFEDRPAKSKQVYLKYSNGLKVSIGTSIEDMDYGDADLPDLLDGPFKATTVNGINAIGKDPYIETTSIGTQANIIGSLSWWVNQVDISLYHPTLTMQELVTIAEAMPDPTWSSQPTQQGTPVPSSG